MSMIDLPQVYAQIDAVIARHKARTEQICAKFRLGCAPPRSVHSFEPTARSRAHYGPYLAYSGAGEEAK